MLKLLGGSAGFVSFRSIFERLFPLELRGRVRYFAVSS
jgi:hypothetical protein